MIMLSSLLLPLRQRMQKQIGYAKKLDEGRETVASGRHTSAHTSPKDSGPGTLAKHWAIILKAPCLHLSQGTSIIKQHKERYEKPPREALTRSNQSLLNFSSRFQEREKSAPAKLIVALTAI